MQPINMYPNSSGWYGIVWEIKQKIVPTPSVILSLNES
jgi:hypothetical protein